MSMRVFIGRITSPIFVPLRRLIAWTDDKFGTCDHQLVLQPRPCFINLNADTPDMENQASELMKKVSKDKANLQGLGGFGDE